MKEKKMQKLKLTALEDDKPVKISIELPAPVHRDLVAYAQVLGRELGQGAPELAKLIPLCWRASWRPIACF